MLSLMSLWMPVVAAAVLCWIAGAIIWTVSPHHKSDFRSVTDEDGARGALRGLQPGQYNIPHVDNPAKMSDEDRRKFEEGPLAFLTVLPNGLPAMGKSLGLQMVYYLVVSTLVAYVAAATLPTESDYLRVFQVTGTVAWLAYGFGGIQDSIWFGRPWSYTFKLIADALVYALLTAGVFGWLWP